MIKIDIDVPKDCNHCRFATWGCGGEAYCLLKPRIRDITDCIDKDIKSESCPIIDVAE